MEKLLFKLLTVTIFLNIWVPKGGIKVKSVPLTMGNIMYFILLIMFALYLIIKKKIYKSKMQLLVIISMLFFNFRLIYAFLNVYIKFADIIQYLIPLCVYPFIYIIIYNCIRDEKQLHKIINIVALGFIFICSYGILQNIFGINKVAIPGITVNYSDYKESPLWYLYKSNGIGTSSKMVSTYQNGNIFGVNLLMIFPLVFETAQNKKKKIILMILFFVAGLLTLSRSVWFGIGIYFLIRFMLNKDARFKTIILRFIIVIALLIVIPYAFYNVPQLQARLTQTTTNSISTLSGRVPGALNLLKFSKNNIIALFVGPYGLLQYDGSAYEMTYFAIYMLGGILGLLVFIIPLCVSLRKFKYYSKVNDISKGCYYSVIVYAIVAFIEGAFWLPPTALNLWIIIGIGMVSIRLEKNKSLNISYKNIS